MNTGTSLNSLLGRILQAGFKLAIRNNRNDCCTLLPRVEILSVKEGWPCPGKLVGWISSLQAQENHTVNILCEQTPAYLTPHSAL